MSGHPEPSARIPIACDMHAFTTDERVRYGALRATLSRFPRTVDELDDGFAVSLDTGALIQDIEEWIALERRCCPFLQIALLAGPDGSRRIEFTGTADVKEFLRREFSFGQRR